MEQLAILGGTPVRTEKISYGKQWIDEDDIAAVADVLRGPFLTCGPKIDELENKLCEITGARHAVAVSNGTAALHIACMAIGIKPGDEVIMPSYTSPVFEDINSAILSLLVSRSASTARLSRSELCLAIFSRRFS